MFDSSFLPKLECEFISFYTSLNSFIMLLPLSSFPVSFSVLLFISHPLLPFFSLSSCIAPSASVIRAVSEQCLQGLPRGLPVGHIHFAVTYLALPSILWSNYRGSHREHSPTPSPHINPQPLPPLLCPPRDGSLVGGRFVFLLKRSLFTLGI